MKAFIFFGKEAKYKTFTWWENFMSGHWNIGRNITIFGENAMHWAVQIRSKKYGWIVFTLPVKTFGKYWGCHIFFSPDGTPSACTYYKSICQEDKKEEELKAKIRKLNFGHNFNTSENREKLRALNDKFSSLKVYDFEIERYNEYYAKQI